MKRTLLLAIALMAAMSTTAFGGTDEEILIDGNSIVTKSSSVYNINPYNPAKIEGVGEGGSFTVLTPQGRTEVSVGSPLMKINGAYRDFICFNDGSWGVMRNVGKMVLDGSEGWQLLDNYRYENASTTIFTCSIEEKILIENGMCTYFDVVTDKVQRGYTYDGLSIGRNNSSINLRIMNVRNMKTADVLKDWLKGRNDAGVPIAYYYALNEPVFEPFSEEDNKKLEGIELEKVRFIDKNINYMVNQEEKAGEKYFVAQMQASGFIEDFMAKAKGVQVYNGEIEQGFFIESISTSDRGFTVIISDKNKLAYKGEVLYSDINFMSEKSSEITFEREDSDTSIKMQVDFYSLRLPDKNESGFTFEQTGLSNECFNEEEMIMPDFIPVLKGEEAELFFRNAILNKKEGMADNTAFSGESINTIADRVLITGNSDTEIFAEVDGRQDSTRVFVSDNAPIEEEVRIMLLGDSLINEDKYPQYLSEMLGENAQLIGTRGKDGSKHEGRGGWAVYDYCNTENKYGFTNPFLNGEKFDFSYYMENQGYDGVDYVVINLGINDLNLLGHNSHEEITSYFDEIIRSVFGYSQDIKIIINTPILLFDESQTVSAANDRLRLIKTFNERYGSQGNEGIYVNPTYIAMDSYLDFKLKEPVLNDENQDGRLIVTDTTHPANSGYEKLAKSTYNMIMHIENRK